MEAVAYEGIVFSVDHHIEMLLKWINPEIKQYEMHFQLSDDCKLRAIL